MKLEDKILLVIDTGQAVEFAVRLAREYGKVMYWSPAADTFPTANQASIGSIDKVERIDELYEGIVDADIVAFPTLGFSSMQTYLRSEGKRVWGNGYGEYLELDRVEFKRWLEANHLPCVPYEVIVGVDNLRKKLADRKNVHIKLPQWIRGVSETFHWINFELSCQWIANLYYELGPLHDKIPFIVEEHLEGFETGTDRFSIDGMFPKKGLMGHEVKDKAYVGKVMDKYPNLVTQPDKYLSNWFKETEYKNFYSTEIRITEDGKEYFIDLAARLPSPPGALELELIENLGEVVFAGSEGTLEEPKYEKVYGAELKLACPDAAESWVPIQFPEKNRRYIKVQNACQTDKTYWLAPFHVPDAERLSTVGLGNTVEEAIKQAVEVAKSIESEVSFEYNKSTLTDALEHIEEAKKYGINW